MSPSAKDPPSAVSLFYSYAREDESLRDELAGHLKILERRGLIRPWHDRQIVPGQDWQQAIDHHLEAADLVVLLLSKDFMASDYIFGVELDRAMQRHAADDCAVVPVLVRPVDIDPDDATDLPFLKLQALPPDLKAVTTWPNRDEAWTQVAKGLRQTVQRLRERPARSPAAGSAGDPAPNSPLERAFSAAEPASDPVMQQVIGHVVDAVREAGALRRAPPLLDHHERLVQDEARILIDTPDPGRVLWVDDRPAGNAHERGLLARLQIETVSVASAQEALERIDADRARGEGFDLVISDWDRPAEGPDAALTLVRELRRRGEAVPVVIYHGAFDAGLRASRATAGRAVGVLGEAIYPSELLTLVKAALAP